jgi:hypothetical protein
MVLPANDGSPWLLAGQRSLPARQEAVVAGDPGGRDDDVHDHQGADAGPGGVRLGLADADDDIVRRGPCQARP